jgi:hypothetical protein
VRVRNAEYKTAIAMRSRYGAKRRMVADFTQRGLV